RTLPCVLLVRVTVAPGSTPACESWTVPTTDALVVCARAAVGVPAKTSKATAAPTTRPSIRSRLIHPPLELLADETYWNAIVSAQNDERCPSRTPPLNTRLHDYTTE